MRIVALLGTVAQGLNRGGDGVFDGSTGTSAKMHIFVADKGDFYHILDGLPQHG